MNKYFSTILYIIVTTITINTTAKSNDNSDSKKQPPLVSHTSFCPFYSTFSNRQQTGTDLLWPICIFRTYHNRAYQQFFPYLHIKYTDNTPREQWWILPIFTHGTSHKNKKYTALFPIAGTLKDVAGYNSIHFYLFPLYISGEKSRSKSKTILWPIFNKTTSPYRTKWRIFPFYGESNTKIAKHKFILWPFIHLSTPQKETKCRYKQNSIFILPFWGKKTITKNNTPYLTSTTYLWPFFSHTKSKNINKLNCPWPFYQHHTINKNDNTKEKKDYWPIYGKTTINGKLHKKYYLWPIINQLYSYDKETSKTFTNFAFFYQHKTTTKNKTKIHDTLKIWPILKKESSQKQKSLQILALWPYKDYQPIQRNLAPLWTLYSSINTKNHKYRSILWGLWQQNKTDNNKQTSILAGIYKHNSSPKNGKKNQLLWFIKW